MPHMPVSELVVLGLIVAGFAAFVIPIFCVSVYVAVARPPGRPVARMVTAARRTERHTHV